MRVGRPGFMVMKTSVYCSFHYVIPAYAATIHKCQGLSLDCAIVDLSDQVSVQE